MDTFNVIVLGNSVTRWLFAFAVIVVVYALLRIGKGFIGRQLSALARKSKVTWDDLVAELLDKWTKSTADHCFSHFPAVPNGS
jgi:hypothetical protein